MANVTAACWHRDVTWTSSCPPTSGDPVHRTHTRRAAHRGDHHRPGNRPSRRRQVKKREKKIERGKTKKVINTLVNELDRMMLCGYYDAFMLQCTCKCMLNVIVHQNNNDDNYGGVISTVDLV